MKDTQSLLTELWDKSFTKEVIEGNLKLKVGNWDRGVLKLIDFLKIHQIKNKNINSLFEESNIISKMKQFNEDDPTLRANVGHRYLRNEIATWKNKTSFFGFSDRVFRIIEKSRLLYEGELTSSETRIFQAIYSQPENAYFFCTNDLLYRKKIDQSEEIPDSRSTALLTEGAYSSPKKLIFSSSTVEIGL